MELQAAAAEAQPDLEALAEAAAEPVMQRRWQAAAEAVVEAAAEPLMEVADRRRRWSPGQQLWHSRSRRTWSWCWGVGADGERQDACAAASGGGAGEQQ
jgi:hypothetical protein